jgi:hypothetical protein
MNLNVPKDLALNCMEISDLVLNHLSVLYMIEFEGVRQTNDLII